MYTYPSTSKLTSSNLLFKLFTLSILLLLYGCSNLKVYQVEENIDTIENRNVDNELIVIHSPVIEHEQFNVYRDSSNVNRFFIVPTKLKAIKSDNNRFLASALVNGDSSKIYLHVITSPPSSVYTEATKQLKDSGIDNFELSFYPYSTFEFSSITNPNFPDFLSVSLVSTNNNSDFPFLTSIILSSKGDSNTEQFRQLISQNLGVLIQSNLALKTLQNGQLIEQVISVVIEIGSMNISNITL